jgi:hypothetical protein
MLSPTQKDEQVKIVDHMVLNANRKKRFGIAQKQRQ